MVTLKSYRLRARNCFTSRPEPRSQPDAARTIVWGVRFPDADPPQQFEIMEEEELALTIIRRQRTQRQAAATHYTR